MVHILTELPAAERPGVMVYLNWASKQANTSSTYFKFHILLTSRPRDMFNHQVATNLKKYGKVWEFYVELKVATMDSATQ